MKQPGRGGRASIVASVCLIALLTASASAVDKDKKEVIQKARASYYSLKSNGLVEFQCSLTPDWDALLRDARKTDPEAVNRALLKLKQLQFTVSMGTSGSARVTHTTVAPTNDEMAKGLDQIYGGMEQMISGFFDTWSPFMISSPLPEADSTFQLEEQPSQWNLSYKEGTADIATILNKDLTISSLKATTTEFNSTLLPIFARSPKGFLLTGYRAEYFGKSASETTKLNVQIAYQEVNGLQLPQTLSLGGSYGGTPFQVAITFSGCKVTKH
jgi:hypothetical protein